MQPGQMGLLKVEATMTATNHICQLNDSDRARIEFCVTQLREIADLGRPVLGDHYPTTLMIIGALNKVLEPNIY